MIQHSNVLQQQQEAAARVRAMEERTKQLVREHPVNVYRGVTLTPTPCSPMQPPMPSRHPAPPVNPASPCEAPLPCEMVSAPISPCEVVSQHNESKGLFGNDGDRWLLLLLAIVLAKNGAGLELVLALLYVAM